MPWHYPLLDLLQSAPPPRRGRGAADRLAVYLRHASLERALGVAWESADPAGRRRIVATLLQRTRVAGESGGGRGAGGLVTLLRHYHELDAGSRDELVRQIAALHTPLRRALAQPARDRAAAFNALSLIEAAGEGDLAYLVVETLRCPEAPLRQRAGQVLQQLASRSDAAAAEQQNTPPLDPRRAQRLIEALDQAVLRYASHEQPAALEAWLTLGIQLTTARPPREHLQLQALDNAEHPAVKPLRDLLSAAEHPGARRGLLPSLLRPTLTLAAVAGLRRCVAEGTLFDALRGYEPLLAWPAVRTALARGADCAALLPAPEQRNLLMPAWLAALPLTDLQRVERLLPLVALPAAERDRNHADPALRLRSLRQLMQLVDAQQDAGDPRVASAAIPAIVAAVADPCEMLAKLAATWLGQRPGGWRMYRLALLRSPHPRIVASAAARLRQQLPRTWAAAPARSKALPNIVLQRQVSRPARQLAVGGR